MRERNSILMEIEGSRWNWSAWYMYWWYLSKKFCARYSGFGDVAIANAEQRVDHEGINGFGGGDILRCLVSGARGLASKNVPDLTGFGWRA